MLRRRLMMAQERGGIVKDGLVFRLNGKNQGGIPGHWIDEIGGNDYALRGVNVENDGIIFNGNINSIGVIESVLKRVNSLCVEVVISFNRIADAIIFCTGSKYGVDTGISDTVATVGYYQHGFTFRSYSSGRFLFAGKKATVYGNAYGSDKCYINKKKIEPVGQESWDFSHKSCIGGRLEPYNQPFFDGKIYEVRLYDRELTEAEILQNQQYDIDTYFGGVIPE